MKLMQELIALTESSPDTAKYDAAQDMFHDFKGKLSLEDCKIIVDALRDNGDIPAELEAHLAYVFSDHYGTSGREDIAYIMDTLARDYIRESIKEGALKDLTTDLFAAVSDEFNSSDAMTQDIVDWMIDGKDNSHVEEFLYDHFANSGQMPYGVMKARTGDPSNWIADKMWSMFKKELAAVDAVKEDAAAKKDVTVPCSVCGKPHQPGGYAHPTKCFLCAPLAVDRAKKLRAKREGTLTKEDWGSSDWYAVFSSIEKDLKRGDSLEDAIYSAASFYHDSMGYDDVEDAVASIKRIAKARKYDWADKV